MPTLLPTLRPLSAPNGHRRLPADRRLVSRPFAGFLHELLCLDEDGLRRYVRVDQLAEWGLDADAARARAWSALDPTDGLVCRDDGLWSVASGDGYEASRLLLPGFLQAFADRVQGEPIAIVPHAREVLIGGADDAAQVTQLLRHAPRRWREAGEPVSPVIYCWRHGRLAPWIPPPTRDPIVAASVKAARLALAAREYASQAEELEDAAPFEVGLAASESVREPYGFCRWPMGFTGTLPEADVVVFAHGDTPVLAVPMADVVRLAGLTATTDLPRRWSANGWPDRPTWAQLTARALDPETLG
jgi:hypothetical protein